MSNTTGYEKSDVNIKKVLIPIVSLSFVMVLCLIGLDQYFVIAKEKMYYTQVLKPESMEIKKLRQKETEMLTNYKMMDEKKRMYQIPIRRAMELEVMEHSK